MTRLLTFLVLLSCAAAAALLAFHAIGWVTAPADELVSSMIYAAAAGAGVALVGGLVHDLSTPDQRGIGVAFFLTAVWFALAPAFGLHRFDALADRIPRGLVEDAVLVIAVFLVLAGRLSLRDGSRPLGFGLALLSLLLVAIDARLLGGTVYPTAYYIGLGAAAVAFASMLVTRPDFHGRIAWITAGILAVAWCVQAFA